MEIDSRSELAKEKYFVCLDRDRFDLRLNILINRRENCCVTEYNSIEKNDFFTKETRSTDGRFCC